ncbi:MAG: FHA domain-containing protein [Pseudomonadales bacterium]|jgi:hypothetical protein|nr:FHA domain-containing protein [Pseudomonadales bacterium]
MTPSDHPADDARRPGPDRLRASGLLLAALLACVGLIPCAHAERILLLVDNSGSMRSTDPERRIPALIDRFVATLPSDSHVGVVAFDGRAVIVHPLRITADWDADLLADLDYGGARTDPARAVERGLYELRQPGAPGFGPDSLLLVTDGVVDLGDAESSRRAEDWLLGELRTQIEEASIAVYAVALTEAADFRILSQLTTASGGDYFRALDTSSAAEAMARIGDALTRRRQAAFVPRVISSAPARISSDAPPSAVDSGTVVVSAPAATSPTVRDDAATASITPPTAPAAAERRRKDPWRWGAAIVLLASGISLLVMVGLRIARGRSLTSSTPAPVQEYFPECHLVDLSGVTDTPRHLLAGRYNMITRLEAPPDDGVHYIRIARKQIGRRHAMIEYRDLAFWISDQNSVNGTFVNGERVTSETRLKHGDRLRFHDYEFEFVISDLAYSNETILGETTGAPIA